MERVKGFCCLAFVAALAYTTSAVATALPPAPVCQVTGQVLEVEKRDKWVAGWKGGKWVEKHDTTRVTEVDMSLAERSPVGGKSGTAACPSVEPGTKQTFQLCGTATFPSKDIRLNPGKKATNTAKNTLEKGQFVTAYTQYEGDEFFQADCMYVNIDPSNNEVLNIFRP